jgi:pimeloyl-ACP methyl ester carboxylesterase
MTPPMDRPSMPELPGVEHRFLDLATGVRAHVALAGPEGAPPVLAVHGWPQHWWCWRRVIAELGGDVRMACVDLRGLGWSGWPRDGDFAKQRMANDAIATLDALGLERALLVGHDWGGMAGYLAALDAPARLTGLLVLSTAHPWQPPAVMARNAWRFAYQLPLASPGLGRRVTRDGRFTEYILRKAGASRDALSAEEIRVYVDALRAPEPARATERIYRSFILHDAPRLGAIAGGRRLEMPTRLLVGRREPLGTGMAQGLERHGDDARVELLDGAGHWVPEERPDAVARAIREMAQP